MRTLRAIGFVLLAACGGRDAHVAEPSTPASVRVVQCAPALAPPVITSAGLAVRPVGTEAELTRYRLRGQAARPSIGVPKKTVEIESVVIVAGTLDRGVLLKELRRPQSAYEACVAKHAAGQKTHGLMTTTFELDPDGRQRIITSTGTATSELRACMNDAIRAQRMPESGGSSRISVRFKLDPTALPSSDAEPELEPQPIEPWSPYAIELAEPVVTAAGIARTLEVAARRRTDAFDACFAGSKQTGSLRAMLELDTHGRVVSSRVGGLGDHKVETCVGDAFIDLEVATPTADAVEIACDLSRGDASPWRVTPEAGYRVINASTTKVTYDRMGLSPSDTDPVPLDGGETYLVIVEPETPGSLLDLALSWAYQGDGTLIALRAPSGAPVLLGAGRSIYGVVPESVIPEVTVTVGSKTVATCDRAARRRGTRPPRTTSDAALSDPRAVSLLIGELATGCRRSTCTGTLGISLDDKTAARDLVEVVSAARRHGFERVMIGSGACTGTTPYDETD